MVDGQVVSGDGPYEGHPQAASPTLETVGGVDEDAGELFHLDGSQDAAAELDTALPDDRARGQAFDDSSSQSGSPSRWHLISPEDNDASAPGPASRAAFTGATEPGLGHEDAVDAISLLDSLLGEPSGNERAAQNAALNATPKLFSTPTRE